MPGDVHGLVRWRAEPERVRVAVRREGAMWVATITSRRDEGARYVGRHRYAYRAVVRALLSAEMAQLDGVNLAMSWAFLHPWTTPQQRACYHVAVERAAR